MPPGQVPTGASGCPPSWPHPAHVCSRNGGGVSAPLCRHITGAAASEAAASTTGTPKRAAGRSPSKGCRQGGWECRQRWAVEQAVGTDTKCREVSQPHCSLCPPGSPGACHGQLLARAMPRTRSPCPSPAEAAHSRLMLPAAGLAAFQRRFSCISYRQEITAKRLMTGGGCTLTRGAWQCGHWGCHHPPCPGYGTSPAQVGQGYAPHPGVVILHCDVLGDIPRWGQRWWHRVP